MVTSSFAAQANLRVADLLRKENRDELETFRFRGGANKVYHIPIGEDGEFVVLKVLPPLASDYRRRLKRPARNLLYGEKDTGSGRERARLEVERYREWQAAGLPVPALIETALPQVRIIQGLPYPTFFTILRDLPLEHERKLAVLRVVVTSLAAQHHTARQLGNKGLVHRDPGPWNIMFDLDRGQTYWFDLEHPAEYPGMTVEALCVRGLRIFTLGVLDHLSSRSDEALSVIADAYEPQATLRALADNLERSASRLPMRVAGYLRRNGRREQLVRIAAALRARLAVT